MKPQNANDIKEVAEALYYEINLERKMNVSNGAYIMTEKWKSEWIKSKSELDLYDWIHKNKQPKNK